MSKGTTNPVTRDELRGPMGQPLTVTRASSGRIGRIISPTIIRRNTLLDQEGSIIPMEIISEREFVDPTRLVEDGSTPRFLDPSLMIKNFEIFLNADPI